MQEIITFRFFIPFFFFVMFLIPTVWSVTDSFDVVNHAAREAARKGCVVQDVDAVEQTALDTIEGSGKPLAYGGVTLFDPQQDVDINFYDGDYVTVTVHYKHYLLFPDLFVMIGGNPIGPTMDMQETASFEREW